MRELIAENRTEYFLKLFLHIYTGFYLMIDSDCKKHFIYTADKEKSIHSKYHSFFI